MFTKAGLQKEDYEKRKKEIGEELLDQVARFISLRILDGLWMDHLENMEYLRDSVKLRAYGQRDPLVEYKSEGHKLFKKLLDVSELIIANTLLKVGISKTATDNQNKAATPKSHLPVQETSQNKPGRNDPCPCGAKKPDGQPVKYKHCHGRIT